MTVESTYHIKQNQTGNIRALLSDVKNLEFDGSGSITGITPDVLSASDYYPFGWLMPGRFYPSLPVSGEGYRFGFNGQPKDDEWHGSTGTVYDYGFRIYDARINRFLSVDPLTKSYPMLTPYQFASNTPIMAIDLDGLEAALAIYGTGKNKGDKSQFKLEADYDVEMKASNFAHFILTGQAFINLLKNKTKDEGSIGRISIFSHSTSHGAYLDDAPVSYGGILRSRYQGLTTANKDYTNTQTVAEIVAEIKAGNIKFEENAMVIFAGCNTGRSKDGNGNIEGLLLAKDFTMATGVTSIGAVGYTAPNNDGTAARTADEGYYMFERIKDNEGNYSIQSTFLGKSIDPSDYKYREKIELKPLKRKTITKIETNN